MHLMDFNEDIKSLCNNIKENSVVNPSLYEKYNVKRGLRNSDGTGVVAGITKICNVHGYVLNEGEVEPIPGQLIYRGFTYQKVNFLPSLRKIFPIPPSGSSP